MIGLGSIGLFFCWLLRKRGAARILGIDSLAQRCQPALRLGTDHVPTKRSIEVLHEARQDPDGWDAPDLCVEAVGHQVETLNDCLGLVKYRGTVLAFGVPDQPVYAIEYETLFRKNANMLACVTPDWSEYLAKSRDIFLPACRELESLVTHRFPIRAAGDAFTMYEKHEEGILKAVINMSEWG